MAPHGRLNENSATIKRSKALATAACARSHAIVSAENGHPLMRAFQIARRVDVGPQRVIAAVGFIDVVEDFADVGPGPNPRRWTGRCRSGRAGSRALANGQTGIGGLLRAGRPLGQE